MVRTRWESSNRPLFLRTVWQDGHHHVLLKKEEDVGKMPRSFRRKPVSSRSARKTFSPPPENSTFKVPSVKLFLENLKNFKAESHIKRPKTEERKYPKSAITVDIIPNDSLRYSDLNKQVSFKTEHRKTLKLSIKSHSIDVNQFSQRDLQNISPPPFSYDTYCVDHLHNSLSERVLIWLDLAIQNQKNFKNVQLKKENEIPKTCPIFEEPKPPEKNMEDLTPTPLVTSRVERNEVDLSEERRTPPRISTAKRQLHIFLPHLPKAKSDSLSLLSSKISSNHSKL